MSPDAPVPPPPAPVTFEDLERAGEITFESYRSSGPGGQNVNKVSTAVRLRFDLAASTVLPEAVRRRLARLAGARVTDRGVLLIEAQRFRTQEQNRDDAVNRLMDLIARAHVRPKPRHPTRPSKASKERRLEGKHRRSDVKNTRGPVRGE